MTDTANDAQKTATPPTTPVPVSPAADATETATLTFPGGQAEFPILPSVDGASTVDISTFKKQTGMNTLDYGFVNTGSTKSAITYIDGDQGILRYRGYPIDQIASNCTFLEVAWLLIYGELPSAAELEGFDARIRRHTLLHEDLRRLFDALPHSAHPMSVLSSAVSALSTYYEDDMDVDDPEKVELQTVRLLAKLPVIAAYAHKKAIGQAFLYPDNSLSFVDNFLRLNFGTMAETYQPNPVLSRALERLLILHEDHEQNASTATVRLVGSTKANMFASISAGINALYGPLHGGANEAVLEMLAADQGLRRARAALRRAREEQGARGQAHGLRAPRLQELRPARQARQGERRRGPRVPGRAGRPARHREGARADRAVATSTSSTASSTRTSTSTPASSTRRWASRRACSRCCSRSGACPAGSPSGASSTTTR